MLYGASLFLAWKKVTKKATHKGCDLYVSRGLSSAFAHVLGAVRCFILRVYA